MDLYIAVAKGYFLRSVIYFSLLLYPSSLDGLITVLSNYSSSPTAHTRPPFPITFFPQTVATTVNYITELGVKNNIEYEGFRCVGNTERQLRQRWRLKLLGCIVRCQLEKSLYDVVLTYISYLLTLARASKGGKGEGGSGC